MTWFFIAYFHLSICFCCDNSEESLFNLNPVQFSYYLSIANYPFNPIFFFIDYNAINFLIFPYYLLILDWRCCILCVMTALKNLQISNALPLLALTPDCCSICFYFSWWIVKDAGSNRINFFDCRTYILKSKNLKKFSSRWMYFSNRGIINTFLLRCCCSLLLLWWTSCLLQKWISLRFHWLHFSTLFAALFFIIYFSFKGNLRIILLK